MSRVTGWGGAVRSAVPPAEAWGPTTAASGRVITARPIEAPETLRQLEICRVGFMAGEFLSCWLTGCQSNPRRLAVAHGVGWRVISRRMACPTVRYRSRRDHRPRSRLAV